MALYTAIRATRQGLDSRTENQGVPAAIRRLPRTPVAANGAVRLRLPRERGGLRWRLTGIGIRRVMGILVAGHRPAKKFSRTPSAGSVHASAWSRMSGISRSQPMAMMCTP